MEGRNSHLEKLSDLNSRMHQELADAYRRLDHDDETRVVVVTGAGRAFCSGADERQNLRAVAIGEERRSS